MKIRLILCLIALFEGFYAFPQEKLHKLSVKDITPELSVYPCQNRPEALVVIHCPENFELEFKSNVDKELNITRSQEGNEKTYSIVFKTREEGTTFSGRVLTIIAPSFNNAYLMLNLKEKEKKEYLVSDPYSDLRSMFYISLDKGHELFSEGMYLQAKDQYNKAKQCPEYFEEEHSVDEQMSLCDSMILWTQIVDTAEARGDIYKAKNYLALMTNKNSNCSTLRERHYNMAMSYNTRCNADMITGEKYMLDKYYDKAKAVYQNAVAMRNPRTAEAELKLHEIEKITYNKTHKARTFMYQYTENRPIGLMYAKCMPTKASGYFSLSMNKQSFDLLFNTNTLYEKPLLDYEVGISAGWTIPIFRSYVFAFFTPFSYTCGGYSSEGVDDDGNIITEPASFLDQKIHLYHAVSPEVGLIAKYWHVALSYKYQYRYWIGDCDGLRDMLGTSKHTIGIGVSW